MTENSETNPANSEQSAQITKDNIDEFFSNSKRQFDSAEASIQTINSFKQKLIDGTPEEPPIYKLIEEIKEKIIQSNALIDEHLKNIKSYSDKLFIGSENETSVSAKVENIVKDLEKAKEEFTGKLSELGTLLSQTKVRSDKALKDTIKLNEQFEKLHEKLFTSTESQESIESLIDKFRKEADEKTKSISTKERELSSFHERVFGNKNEDGKQISGYQQEFESKLKSIDDFHKSEATRFNELFKKIEGLLPGATSAGLAHAYDVQKNSYGSQIKLWQATFISTMILMIGIGVWAFAETIDAKITLSEAIVSFIRKLPFFIPLIWLGVFAGKRLSQNKRMQQEYAFKETLAKSFDGHKTQVEALKIAEEGVQKELMAKLLTNLIESTGKNPSSTLDNKAHDEKSPISEWFDKLWPKRKDDSQIGNDSVEN